MEANNRAMREACKVVIDAIETIYAHEDDAEFVRVWLDQTKKACEEALAAPPRNCDVGTAREQNRRFERYCDSEVCECKMCKNVSKYLVKAFCALAWSQMPYEEGGAE